MMKMNVFENLIEKIQNKLAFGSTKQKNFMYHVKTLLKGEQIDPQIIWRGLEGYDGVQNAQLYCQLIFNALYSEDMKQKNYILNQQQMLATLLPLKFYKVRQDKHHPSLNERRFSQQKILVHSKWINSYFQGKTDFFSIINRLVFAPLKLGKNDLVVEQILSQMDQCQEQCRIIRHKQHLQNNYKRLKRVCFPKINQLETRSLTYGYICLIDDIKSRNSTLRSYQYKKLIHLIQFYMNSRQQRLIEYLTLLLHFVNSFITFYGCQYDDILKKLLALSIQVRMMPGDIGKIGQQLFHVLFKEIKVQGYAFRKKLKESFPELNKKQVHVSIKQFYFITNSINFLNQQEKVNLHLLRKKVINHLLKISGFNEKQLREMELLIKNAKEQEVFGIYEKALKICQISYEVDSFQKSKTLLKESLEKLIISTRNESSKEPFNLKQNIFRDISLQKNLEHPLSMFQFPNICGTHIPLSQFLDLKSNINLEWLILKEKALFPEVNYFSKNKLQLVFYGNCIQFFRFIQPIGQYLQNKTLDKLIGLKIYYIPKKNQFRQNYLSDYIGCFDILYQRTIVNCFGERAIYPYIQPNQNNKRLLPIQLMNKNIQCYLKQAQNIFPLTVFKCKIRKIGLNSNKFQQSYYFYQSVNLGLFAEAEIIRVNKYVQSKQKNTIRDLPDIISNKLKKYEPLQVLIQIERFEKLQGKISEHKQKMILVDDIQICNLPKSYFLGKKPRPSTPFLQVTILTTTNGKLFKKQLLNSYNFKQKRQNFQISQAFKDLFIESTVKSIRIQNLKKQIPLKIVIDGQILEGIDYIEIQAATSIDKRTVTLPIQTFLPIK